MKKAILLTFILTTTSKKNSTTSDDQHLALSQKLKKLYEESELPGFSVAVINNKKILYQNSLGYANIKNNKKFSNTTIQNIGSISKTFIAVAIMKAVEQEILKLDTNINNYLPFCVTHPHYPNQPITVRHLATHTSGILDGEIYFKSYLLQNPSDIKIADYPVYYQELIATVKTNIKMEGSDFLKNSLTTTGKWYSEDNFSEYAPGNNYQYSNIAATLAAYVVESATQTQYEEYTYTHILKPLQMNTSGWTYNDIDKNDQATLYYTKKFETPLYSLITKAHGGLLTNITDLSKFLIEMIKGHQGNGTLLSDTSYTELFANQNNYGITGTQSGLFWNLKHNGKIEHSGGDPGIITFSDFDPLQNRGHLFMTNISHDFNSKILNSIHKIWNTIRHEKN